MTIPTAPHINKALLALRKASEHERRGHIAHAVHAIYHHYYGRPFPSIPEPMRSALTRLLSKASHKAAMLISGLDPEPMFTTKANPLTYASDVQGCGDELPPLIALTAISSRLHGVRKTLESLLMQRHRLHSINLYISHMPYLLDQGISASDHELKNLATLGVNIYSVPNIGPYRKQYPIITQLRKAHSPHNTPVITVDDDVVYPNTMVGALMSSNHNSSSIIAHRGREMVINGGKVSSYSTFRKPREKTGLLNLATGKNGILYRMRDFPSAPTDFVGPILAPTADDIWCKWATAWRCVPTCILCPEAAFSDDEKFPHWDPSDKKALFHEFNNHGSNDQAMVSLEAFYSRKGLTLGTLLS